jgi:RNA polymerase sigma factor (sigma-70 family)
VLGAARLGREWAWNTIYRNLAPVVLSYLRGIGAADAEDLAGEVFLQVARDLPRFDGGEAEFRSWVLVMAHHRFLDQCRYNRRRPVQPASPESLAHAGSAGNVEDEALGNLASERVRHLIEALTPDQRDVLLLRIFGGLTVDEVAATVGKRPSAVKALQRRGLGAIQRAMAAEDRA